MSRSYPGLNVAGTHHGYVEEELVEPCSNIGRSRAQVVIVGAGAPKQEHLVLELRKALPELIFLTCGGYLDQVSQPTPYYPRWAYPLRLNWVVRLWREPKRLWRRYLIGNPKFVAESVAWRIRRSPNVDACSRRSLGGPPDN
jgi:exopolysaccharide biosynthesis WecB/TagA/CpsF family protein